MENLELFTVLAHPTSLQILSLLKNPTVHFTQKNGLDKEEIGVCVLELQEALGISQ